MKLIIIVATLLTAGCATGLTQAEKDIARDQADWTQEDMEDLIAASNMTERFECRGLAEDSPVQVVAEVREYMDEDGTTVVFGVIAAAGHVYDAQYNVEGFERRWDFGGEYSNNYGFTIDLDHNGEYLDFTDVEVGESVLSSKSFMCVQGEASAFTPVVTPAGISDRSVYL